MYRELWFFQYTNTHTRYTTGPNQSGCQTPTAPRCGAAQSALFFLAASGKLPSRRGWTMAPPFMYWRPADGEETRTSSLHRPLLPPRPIAHTLCSFPLSLASGCVPNGDRARVSAGEKALMWAARDGNLAVLKGSIPLSYSLRF
jgi:hypothetical protein